MLSMSHRHKNTPEMSAMREGKLALLLAMLLLGALVLMGAARPSALAQQTRQEGIFGTITSFQELSQGLTVLTVESVDGIVHEIEVLDELTIVNVPSQDTSSARDLAVGDFVGSLVLETPAAVNINTASVELLSTLPQVGPVRAQAIVSDRAENGAFDTVVEIVRVPGISSGVFDAIRLLIVVNDRVQALRVMVKPERAVLSGHLTGVVVNVGIQRLTIMDQIGNRVDLELPDHLSPVTVGRVVTVATRLNTRLGTLEVGGLEPAQKALDRLAEDLEIYQGALNAQSVKNLEQRLQGVASSYVTTLGQVAEKVPDTVPSDTFLAAALTNTQDLLRRFSLGEPLLVVTGVVDLVDLEGQVIGLTPKGRSSVALTVDELTTIKFEGQPVPLHEDLFGRAIKVSFEAVSLRAQAIEILPSGVLSEDIAFTLILWATVGEVEGTVTELDLSSTPPTVTIQTSVGDTVRLSVPDGTRIDLEGARIPLDDTLIQLQVKVRFDPDKLEAVQIEVSRLGTEEAFISGVMTALIRKEARQITIASSATTTRITLNIDDDSILEKDGLQVPINELVLGDLVRPTTRYDTTTLILRKLVLKSPLLPITGVVRGIDPTPESGRLTVFAPGRDMVTLVVTDDTEISRLGVESLLLSIRLGERLGAGSVYNAVTLEAQRLVVITPKALQVRGVISDLDTTNFVISVQPLFGNVLTLLVPNKPGIVTYDGDASASFLELQIGDVVEELFYRPDDRVVVRLVTSSP